MIEKVNCMSEIELKPCPFCGGTNIKVMGTYKYCKCKTCGATSGGLAENEYALNASKEDAVRAWNNRESVKADVTGTNVGYKTNYDRIRSMSIEELANAIYGMDEPPKFALPFCGNSDRCIDAIDSDEGVPDEMCRQCLMDWLNAESEE